MFKHNIHGRTQLESAQTYPEIYGKDHGLPINFSEKMYVFHYKGKIKIVKIKEYRKEKEKEKKEGFQLCF